MVGCADLPTTGLDWVLQQHMELLLAFLEVAIALLSTVYDLQEVVCFGTQAMRVRCHLLGVSDVCMRLQCVPALSSLDGQGRRTAAHHVALCSAQQPLAIVVQPCC